MTKAPITDINRHAFKTRLLTWFTAEKRPMPWRDTDDPYAIWVSEVMLQQTQVATVIPYFRRFLQAFPTPRTLADAPMDTVLKNWEGLGYYARARNLQKAARIICDTHRGRIPADPDALGALPGVGPYIQAAVLSIAFNRPLPAVDGNVKRVLARLHCDPTPTNAPSSEAAYRPMAQALLNRDFPGDHNQAMMELGARICTPTNPRCHICPVVPYCAANDRGAQEQYPVRLAKKKVPTHKTAVGVVQKRDKLLICRRRDDGLLGGLWEFPGGKIETGETPQEACLRTVTREVGLHVTVEAHLANVRHAYTHFKIEMTVFVCRYRRGRIRLNGPVDFRWVTPSQLPEYAFHRANDKFIPHLQDALPPPL